MAVNITLQSAISLAEEIVASEPENFVYINNAGERAGTYDDGAPLTDCDYFTPDGEGSCIVGKVILAAGVSFYAADRNIGAVARHYLMYLNAYGVISISREAIDFLGKIQHHQDRGVTWAKSLERAKEYVAASL